MKQLFLRPLLVSAALFLLYGILQILHAPVGEKIFQYVLTAAFCSVSVVVVRALKIGLCDSLFHRSTGRPTPSLLSAVFSVAAYAALLPMIYSTVFHQSVPVEILTTSAAVTVVIGFALQDTLGNFFAGLSLQVEQPFRLGDVVRVRHIVGRVETMTWRSTCLRTNDNTIVSWPNSIVAREAVEIFAHNHLNRRVMTFPVPYSVPPETILSLVREAVSTVPHIAAEREPVVRINSFSESHLTYEVLYWVKDYMLVVDMDARMRERIWYAFQRHGIQPLPVHRILHESQAPSILQEPPDYARIMAHIDLFEPLGAAEQSALVSTPRRAVYAPGERLLRHGEPGSSMFVVCRGRVEICLPGQREQRIALLGPGEYFGEMALFTGAPRSADVYAFEEVEVFEICKSMIEPLLQENLRLAEAFSHKIVERQTNLAALSVQTAREDVLRQKTILERMKRFFSLRS